MNVPHGEILDIPKCPQTIRFVLWSTYKDKRKEGNKGGRQGGRGGKRGTM